MTSSFFFPLGFLCSLPLIFPENLLLQARKSVQDLETLTTKSWTSFSLTFVLRCQAVVTVLTNWASGLSRIFSRKEERDCICSSHTLGGPANQNVAGYKEVVLSVLFVCQQDYVLCTKCK